jgi:hypothetical protein
MAKYKIGKIDYARISGVFVGPVSSGVDIRADGDDQVPAALSSLAREIAALRVQVDALAGRLGVDGTLSANGVRVAR